MKEYGNKMIAEVGHILIASNGQRGFALPMESGVTFDEVAIDLTSVEPRPFGDVSFGGVINFHIDTATKKNLINKIWSNDDQIAIMLNKDIGGEELTMYYFMQEWRSWISQLIQIINSNQK